MNPTDKTYEQESEAITIDQRDDATKEREEELLRYVMDDYAVARDARVEQEADWDKYFDMYMCHLASAKYPWRSRVYDPEVFAAVETVYPRIVNTLLGGPEVFGVKPTEQGDVSKARKSKLLLDYQTDRMNLYEKLGEICKDALIYGTGLGKVRWHREYEPRVNDVPVLDEFGLQMVDPETGAPATEKEKQFVKVYDDPRVERVDIKDLYVDPDATCVEDARYIVHRVTRTRDYLKKKEVEGVYRNIDLVPENDASDQFVTNDSRKSTAKASTDTVVLHDKQMNLVTLYEYYGLCDIDNDGYLEECIITVANGSVVIRYDYNPFPGGFKPFIRFTPIPIPGRFNGISMIKPIAGIQDALNDRTNQIGDNISLVLNRMYKVNRHADIDADQLVSSPGGIIEMNQMTDLEPLETPDIIGSVFPEVGRLENKIQRALGTYDYAAGGAPQRQEAATTVISLQQVAEIRFKTILIYFERQVIRPLGNMLLRLTKKYMEPQRELRIVGKDAMQEYAQDQFMMITPDDILDNPDIFAVGAMMDPSISKQMQMQSLMQFMTIVAGNPQLMMSPMFGIDWSVIVEELPYLLDIKLKRPLVIPLNPMLAYQEVREDEQMADQMMMSQMAMMMQGMSGMGGPGSPAPGGEQNEASAPSRTKGELAKRGGNNGKGKGQNGTNK